MPNRYLFITPLVVFEATVGLLVLAGGRRTQVGLVAAIAFHVALLSFGWGFALWSIPMIAAFVALLRAEQRQDSRLIMLRHMTTRSIAILALIIAVIVLLIILL